MFLSCTHGIQAFDKLNESLIMEERNKQEVNPDADAELTHRNEGYEPELVTKQYQESPDTNTYRKVVLNKGLTTHRPIVVMLYSSGTV